MKATIEVAVTLKFHVDATDHRDAERQAQWLANEVSKDLPAGLYLAGQLVTPQTKVDGSVTFVELNW